MLLTFLLGAIALFSFVAFEWMTSVRNTLDNSDWEAALDLARAFSLFLICCGFALIPRALDRMSFLWKPMWCFVIASYLLAAVYFAQSAAVDFVKIITVMCSLGISLWAWIGLSNEAAKSPDG